MKKIFQSAALVFYFMACSTNVMAIITESAMKNIPEAFSDLKIGDRIKTNSGRAGVILDIQGGCPGVTITSCRLG